MKSKFSNFIQRDRFCIPFLLALVIIPRLYLIFSAPNIYFFDSYQYLDTAIDFSSKGVIQLEVGFPFIMVVGFFIGVFGSLFGVFLISRLLMVFLSAVLVVIMYLVALRVSGRAFALLAGLMVAFEPTFLSFSIVPHNDVFAITMSLMALYLAMSSKKSHQVISPFFFYIAIFTRPELYPVFLVPIILVSFHKSLRNGLRQSALALISTVSVYLMPLPLIYFLAETWTRFTILEKTFLFLRPDLLLTVITSVFAFYEDPFLNEILFILFVIGVATCVAGIFVDSLDLKLEEGIPRLRIKFKNGESVRETLRSDEMMFAFCLAFILVLHIMILTVYAFGYAIVDGTLQIIPTLSARYVILPRLLISFSLAYPLSLAARRAYIAVARKND